MSGCPAPDPVPTARAITHEEAAEQEAAWSGGRVRRGDLMIADAFVAGGGRTLGLAGVYKLEFKHNNRPVYTKGQRLFLYHHSGMWSIGPARIDITSKGSSEASSKVFVPSDEVLATVSDDA